MFYDLVEKARPSNGTPNTKAMVHRTGTPKTKANVHHAGTPKTKANVHHAGTSKTSSDGDDEFVCPVCSKELPTSACLGNHQRTERHMFPCPKCKSTFYRQRSLDLHTLNTNHIASETESSDNGDSKLYADVDDHPVVNVPTNDDNNDDLAPVDDDGNDEDDAEDEQKMDESTEYTFSIDDPIWSDKTKYTVCKVILKFVDNLKYKRARQWDYFQNIVDCANVRIEYEIFLRKIHEKQKANWVFFEHKIKKVAAHLAKVQIKDVTSKHVEDVLNVMKFYRDPLLVPSGFTVRVSDSEASAQDEKMDESTTENTQIEEISGNSHKRLPGDNTDDVNKENDDAPLKDAEIVTSVTEYECQVTTCMFKHSDPEEVTAHYKATHDVSEDSFNCHLCEVILFSLKQFSDHMSSHQIQQRSDGTEQVHPLIIKLGTSSERNWSFVTNALKTFGMIEVSVPGNGYCFASSVMVGLAAHGIDKQYEHLCLEVMHEVKVAYDRMGLVNQGVDRNVFLQICSSFLQEGNYTTDHADICINSAATGLGINLYIIQKDGPKWVLMPFKCQRFESKINIFVIYHSAKKSVGLVGAHYNPVIDRAYHQTHQDVVQDKIILRPGDEQFMGKKKDGMKAQISSHVKSTHSMRTRRGSSNVAVGNIGSDGEQAVQDLEKRMSDQLTCSVDECKFKIADPDKMTLHFQKVHVIDPNESCPIETCNFSSKDPVALVSHFNDVHDKVKADKTDTGQQVTKSSASTDKIKDTSEKIWCEGKYKCPKCETFYVTSEDVIMHQVKLGHRFYCPVCLEPYNTTVTLHCHQTAWNHNEIETEKMFSDEDSDHNNAAHVAIDEFITKTVECIDTPAIDSKVSADDTVSTTKVSADDTVSTTKVSADDTVSTTKVSDDETVSITTPNESSEDSEVHEIDDDDIMEVEPTVSDMSHSKKRRSNELHPSSATSDMYKRRKTDVPDLNTVVTQYVSEDIGMHSDTDNLEESDENTSVSVQGGKESNTVVRIKRNNPLDTDIDASCIGTFKSYEEMLDLKNTFHLKDEIASEEYYKQVLAAKEEFLGPLESGNKVEVYHAENGAWFGFERTIYTQDHYLLFQVKRIAVREEIRELAAVESCYPNDLLGSVPIDADYNYSMQGSESVHVHAWENTEQCVEHTREYTFLPEMIVSEKLVIETNQSVEEIYVDIQNQTKKTHCCCNICFKVSLNPFICALLLLLDRNELLDEVYHNEFKSMRNEVLSKGKIHTGCMQLQKVEPVLLYQTLQYTVVPLVDFETKTIVDLVPPRQGQVVKKSTECKLCKIWGFEHQKERKKRTKRKKDRK